MQAKFIAFLARIYHEALCICSRLHLYSLMLNWGCCRGVSQWYSCKGIYSQFVFGMALPFHLKPLEGILISVLPWIFGAIWLLICRTPWDLLNCYLSHILARQWYCFQKDQQWTNMSYSHGISEEFLPSLGDLVVCKTIIFWDPFMVPRFSSWWADVDIICYL